MIFVWMLLPVVAGYAAMASLLPKAAAPAWTVHLMRVSLGLGLGIGITSLLSFALLIAGASSTAGMIGIELTVTACAIVLSRKAWCVVPIPGVPAFKWTWVLLAVIAIQLGFTIAGFFDFTAVNPHGEWDAWSVWNVRAKLIAAPGGAWRMAFSPLLEHTHPEYPLLLSGFIGRVWRYTGETGSAVPIGTSLLFLLGTTGVLASTVGALGSRTLGLLAAIVLLGTPAFLVSGSIQYADVPVAFYFLSATALGALSLSSLHNSRRYAALAGVFAALSAWTKNEGLLFFCILALVLTAFSWRKEGSAAAFRGAGAYLAGSAAPMAVVLWFKWFLAPPETIVGAVSSMSLAAKISDLHRWAGITRAFGAEFLNLGNLLTHPILLLAAAILMLRITSNSERRLSALASVVTVALMLAGYFGIFLITSLDLNWQLDTALSRLLIQVWPASIFAAVALLTGPEESV